MSDGMHSGTEERETSNFLPRKFLFATRNPAGIPIMSASAVDNNASLKVKIIMLKSGT